MTEPRPTRQRATRPGRARPTGRRASAGIPQTPGVEDDRLAELEARLARLEASPGLRRRGRALVGRVVPSEASHHFRNAGREQLLGVRAIVDFWIRRIDALEAAEARGRSEHETIELD
ncbi:MAG TPA: hypothetical protein VFW92_06630 [Candidatus Limnocylindrales bacterium]|nr:hypothetical protein [Candidatus Limnocylindrales bacterium]